jgi:hypothetical protein
VRNRKGSAKKADAQGISQFFSVVQASESPVRAQPTDLGLAAAYDTIGDNENAATHVRKAREAGPKLSISTLWRASHFATL